ncbi:MAG TPA: phage virion morphogenesis protein [Methanocorpusculum sp.]|nr:phage virion morphogenesis protein [Methanocorpusculum sp.]
MVKRSNPGWSRRISEKLRNTMPNTLAAGMTSVEQEAKRIVYLGHPDHLDRQTGRLRESITTMVTESGMQVSATVGTSLSYAPVHEFGCTVPHKNGSVSFIPPRPFLLPAFAAKKQDVRKKVHEDVRSIINGECHD